MKPWTYLLLLSSLLVLTGLRRPMHEFYVSITELEVKDDTLQISLRIFTDDLQFALNDGRDDKIFLNENGASPKHFVHIRDYVNRYFAVANGAKSLRIDWLGHEFEDDVCWIYGQVAIPSDQRILFVRNQLMMNVYPQQQNIMHFSQGETTDTKLAINNRPEVRFTRP